jgi:hypothetical protein
MGGPCSAFGERRVVYRFSVGKGEGMNHFKDPGIEGRILLRWVFRKWGGACTGLFWLRTRTGRGHL